MSVDIGAAVDDLVTALGGIDGLRVFGFVPDSVSPPAAVVDVEGVDYDNTMRRGTDRVTFTVTVAVGNVVDRAAHEAVNGYMSGTAPATEGVKAALDAIGTHVRVMDARKAIVMFARQEFLGATFAVDWIE